MFQACDKLAVLTPGLIPANKIQTACQVSEIMVLAISISGDIMTSTFFLGRISKIGDGYCLRVDFLHIHGKFHEDPMKTLGCETKNVKKIGMT